MLLWRVDGGRGAAGRGPSPAVLGRVQRMLQSHVQVWGRRNGLAGAMDGVIAEPSAANIPPPPRELSGRSFQCKVAQLVCWG